jgi:hypothetical protein
MASEHDETERETRQAACQQVLSGRLWVWHAQQAILTVQLSTHAIRT